MNGAASASFAPTAPAAAHALDGNTLVRRWAQRVQAAPQAPALTYFDTVLTARQVDELSDALAVALA